MNDQNMKLGFGPLRDTAVRVEVILTSNREGETKQAKVTSFNLLSVND